MPRRGPSLDPLTGVPTDDRTDARTDGPSTTWTARRVRASGSSIALAIAVVVAVYLAQDLFLAASQPIGWVAAAAATALLVAPLVELIARVIPRGLAALVTLVLGAAVVGTVGLGVVGEVRDQLTELGETLPAAAAEIEARGGIFADLQFASLVQDLITQTTERITPEPTVAAAAGTAPAFFVSGILVVFIVLWAGRMFGGVQRQISDDRRRERFARVTVLAVRWTQRYLVGSLAVAVLVAFVGAGLARLAGLPTPLVLGVVLGTASLVPYLGVLFGGLAFVVLSAALEPTLTTVALVGGLIAVQAGVTWAYRRIVEPRSLRVGPAVVVVMAIVGSDVYGIGGALVAVVAGIVATALLEAYGETQGDAHGATDAPDHPVSTQHA